MAAHGIPVSVQEMIIRQRKDRFIVEILPNVPPEIFRRPPVAAATGLPDISQISPLLHLRPPLFHILKNCCCCYCCSCCYSSSSSSTSSTTNTMQHQHHAAAAPAAPPAPAPCGSSAMRQQHHAAAAPCGSSTTRQHSYV